MSDQNKSLAVTNYDRIEALANNDLVMAKFSAVLGSRSVASAYIHSALLAVMNSPALMECEPASVMQTALRAATLRLSCDPALGHAYPVPYKGKATLQLGYKGIQQMAIRTGKYRFIQTSHIYEGQEVIEDQLTGKTMLKGARKSDKVIGYFNYFELLSGYGHFLFMTVEELWAHAAKYSQSYQYAQKSGRKDSKWHTEFEKMAKKTVLKLNLQRHGYLNPEDAAIVGIEAEDAGLNGNVAVDANFEDIDTTPNPKTSRSEAQNLKDLGFGDDGKDTIEGQFTKPKPAEPVQPAPPASPSLRYQPEALKNRLAEIAASPALANKQANGKRQTVAMNLEEALSMTTDPKASRHQLLQFLTGCASLKDVPDAMILAMHSWLKPTQDSGGAWVIDPMSAREVLAAYNASQPPRDELF